MDALSKARQLIEMAESEFDTSEAKDGNAFYRGLSEMHYSEAAIYAAVAQAEQLKEQVGVLKAHSEVMLFQSELLQRIADALDKMSLLAPYSNRKAE